MDMPYGIPPDEYALALLTQVAMNSRSTHDNSGLRPSSPELPANMALQISNQQNSNAHFDSSNTKTHRSSDLPSTYDTSVLSTSNMTTMFGSTSGNTHNPYLDSAFRGIGNQINRNYVNNLGILSAETYNNGSVERSTAHEPPKQGNDPEMPFGLVDGHFSRKDPEVEVSEDTMEVPELEPAGKKKKQKRRVENISGDDEDGKKKSRGRPRVDTKDETAADRRRTQIRMAQRAYRNRKETTISSLEKKVQDLRGTNEEMSNIFITLYDFAVGRGLLQREPEFGQQLQSTTERFLALAKASNEDLIQDDHSEGPEKNDTLLEEMEAGPPKKKGKRSQAKNRKDSTPPTAAPITTPETPAWGGYQVDHSREQLSDNQPDFEMQSYDYRPRDVQVVTRPTQDNASFPFDFNMDDLQSYRVELAPTDDLSQFFLPLSQPPLPRSHAYGEFSFGRRLLREALEGAMRLLSVPDLPRSVWKKVFSFSGEYQEKDAIKARISKILEQPAKSSLQNWKAPWTNIGGAGTFYPLPQDNVNEDLMPKIRPGYSMGPHTSRVTEVEDLLDENLYCNKPGLEGEFFDANDVEQYLRSRGLEIPENADTVTAQIDLSIISEAASPKSGSSVSSGVSPATPKTSLANFVLPSYDSSDTIYDVDSEGISSDAFPFPLISAKWTPNATNENIEPSFFTMANEGFARMTPTIAQSDTRPTITLNVRTLISEIISRAVCLDRAPGFRPSDVNAAIVAAVRAH
ncbi:BZIP family transcription factor [Glarea lozoyensis ATCC 20868]|uniref:BZIP family transcription factor n=1 Tax=Glarea lozoyensis (strain ATCC 20868 / MF5171) TaxID=1116229 RepID=S3CR81_GLAL2|nr:BZIP family transcription factor [Glarea lozoyensis ATCC 20868]EPE28967.1 BZIP family transcription factor [Glarea lozoyensis ATCC 20868]